MTQATQLLFPSFSEDEKIELPKEPRLLFFRVSLDIALRQDSELRRLVNSNDPADARQAIAILQADANSVPEKELIALCWDHQNASYQLLHTEADSDAFSFSDEDLYISAVFCAAELQVSRKAETPELEMHIFNLVTSANKLITGWWKGKQLGLVRFLAAAARHNGAIFAPNGVSHKAWGLDPNAKLEDLVRAVRDVDQFPSSLHLTAWKLGAWPILLVGTQTTMSLGWVLRYLYDFQRALPDRCEDHRTLAATSSEEEELSKKRKLSKGSDPEK